VVDVLRDAAGVADPAGAVDRVVVDAVLAAVVAADAAGSS
jgi:hypothetical protein